MTAAGFFDILKRAANGWVDHHAQSMGAALSYYTVFSIAPVLLIAISIAGLVFGQAATQHAVIEQLRQLLGPSGADVVVQVLKNVSKPAQGVTAMLIGVIVLIVGATSVFAELQGDLDRIWDAPVHANAPGWRTWLRTRLLSMSLVLAVGFLLLVSLTASAAFDAFAAWSSTLAGAKEALAHAVNFVVGTVLTAVMFGLIYRYMPRVRVQWRDVVIGSMVTALLFALGKFAIGLYIGRTAVASTFGAAGSLAALLAWVYYSAQIFLFGAEFTWAYAHALGSRVDANRRAPVFPAGA